MRQQRKGRERRLHNNEHLGEFIKISDIVANERTEILSYKTYEGATHKIDDTFYAKDYIGRWCYIAENGDAWPAHSKYFDQIEKDAVPIGKSIDKTNKQL